MKIDSNLRAAIRSAHGAQPDNTYTEHREAQKKAVAEFVEFHPGLRIAFKGIASLRKEIDELHKQIADLMPDIGISEGMQVTDEEKFELAGGVIVERRKCWRFDEAMAKLAACEPEEAEAILKTYNINWKEKQ